MLGIVGSGSGKSTLLNVLGGLDRPTGGRTLLGRQDLGQMSRGRSRRIPPQDCWLRLAAGGAQPHPLSGRLENIELPLTLSGQVGKSTRERAGAPQIGWLA